MADLRKTVFHRRHVQSGAKMVEFAGWEMPVFYPTGILEEHAITRKHAGLFDVSHMGRFLIRGKDAEGFLQHTLTNDVSTLNGRGAQYTFIPTKSGGAVDDAYLYRIGQEEYLLVVNAANEERDWSYLQSFVRGFQDIHVEDQTEERAMLALQGPASKEIMERAAGFTLPKPTKNSLQRVEIDGTDVILAGTGYTGSPVGLELFFPREAGPSLWDLLTSKGAAPVGLAARDTLRLEAGLPLYGYELGTDREGKEIPIFACPTGRFGVDFSPRKGDFNGRTALKRQEEAFRGFLSNDFSRIRDLPRLIKPVAVTGRGIARHGDRVEKDRKYVGYVTSGTVVPLWEDRVREPSDGVHKRTRAIALAYLKSDLLPGEEIQIEVRGRGVLGMVVSRHLKTDGTPWIAPTT
jgi:aminomethyltransferase